jgi:protein-L-isoaspartate(D-aspartate) O-methyltransferase
MDFAAARLNMVESQVRPNGITDQRIITAMSAVPRENFVPKEWRSLAYMDEDVPLTGPASGGPPRYLVEPMAFARLLQLATLEENDRILHVGAGTGYGTAVIAELCQHVVALETNTELADAATSALVKKANVKVVKGPLELGWAAEAPYDVILIEGRVGQIPESLLAQLADGGRLVTVLGDPVVAKAVCVTKQGQNISERRGFDATVAELPGFQTKQPEFEF